MADTTNLVTPKAAEGHAPATFKGDAAAMPHSPDKTNTTATTSCSCFKKAEKQEKAWPKTVPKDPTDAQTTFKKAVKGAASAVADNNADAAEANRAILDVVVDANLGTQAERLKKRTWSLIELFVKLTVFILIETTLCFIFYYVFVANKPRRRNRRLDKYGDVNGTIVVTTPDPYDGKTVGWPSLPGVSTVLAIIGSALTFLLVFSLNWTFQRWRSARALMGGTITTLKHFYVHVSTACPEGVDPKMWLALQWFGAAVIICINNLKPEESILAKLGIVKDDSDDMAVKDNDDTKDKKKEFRIENDNLKLEVYRAHTQIGREIQKLRKGKGKGKSKVKDGQELEGPTLAVAYNMHSKLLHSFEGLCKYKTTSLPLLLKGLLYLLTYAYTFVIFPVLLPYTFVMALDEPAARNAILTHGSYAPCYIAIFVVSSSLILFYFNMLLSISQEFEDPFGADYSDIRLRRDFMEPLLEDFQSLKTLKTLEYESDSDDEE